MALLPALPPIPASAVEKIGKGIFVDFKELFSDNIALVSQLHGLSHADVWMSAMQMSGHMRDIMDPLVVDVLFIVICGCISGSWKTCELMVFFFSWVAYYKTINVSSYFI